jgi:adenylate kinase
MSSGARFILLGKQGAGKGTQAVRVAAHYSVPHISTGDMFRAAVAAGTPFGVKAKSFMDNGELVPDEVVIGVIAERLAQDDTVERGFVLDGFPRTRPQAEELERMLAPAALDAAVDIDVPTAVVLHRLSGRRVCVTCGAIYHVDAPPKVQWKCDEDGGDVVQRHDDEEAAISKRLELYERETGPLIGYYAEVGILITINGVGTPDEVFVRVITSVEGQRRLRLPTR